MKNKTKHPTKVAKNRITALLLAFLLSATVLIPQIPVKAQDTATGSSDTTENNDRDGGGHQVEGGDEESSQRPTHDPDDDATITTNEDGTRTLKFMQRVYLIFKDNGGILDWKYSFEINGKGKFVIVSFTNNAHAGGDDGIEIQSYLLSNETFNCRIDMGSGLHSKSVLSYNGVYYTSLLSACTVAPISTATLRNFPNMRRVTLNNGDTFQNVLERLIDSGAIDLSKDDYKDTDTNPDSYVRDKSLGYLQGVRYYEVKNTGNERDAVISWNASNPELNDCQIEIRANNFYVEWWNKKTSEICSYKKYGDGIYYKDGKYTFKTLEPCRSWLSDKNIDVSIKTQSYGTTEYYVRLLRLDKENNVVKCGGWVKIDINRGTSTKLPDSTSDTGDWDDDTGDWKDDDDSDDSYHDHVGDDGEILPVPDLNFDGILESIYSLFGLIGSFPTFLGQIFSFLPTWLISSVSVSIALILVIAVYKMIRG